MVQVFFVMLFFPVVMNALQYYIIDSFIKNQSPADHEPIPSEDGEEEDDDDDENDGRHRRRRSRGGAEQYDSGDEDTAKNGETIKASELSDKADPPDRPPKLKSNPKKLDEYDPATDGDRGSSSASSTSRGDGTVSRQKNDEADKTKT